MAELSGYVVVISWWGKIGADGEGSPTNALVPAVSFLFYILLYNMYFFPLKKGNNRK